MFGIGETELVIIVVFAFLLFGPDKLPGMGRTLGRVLRQFREASDGFTEVVQTNIVNPASEELEKSPKQRKREVAEELAEDGDAELREGAAPQPKRETFAERKARLKAEREAAQAESADAADAQDRFGDEDESFGADSDEDLLADQAPAPARRSAADLYAVSSMRSSRSRTASEATTGDQNTTPTSGEEDGSEEA